MPKQKTKDVESNDPSYNDLLKSYTIHLLQSGRYSDLNLVCNDEQHQLHRGLMCLASKYFEKACDGNFEVGFE